MRSACFLLPSSPVLTPPSSFRLPPSTCHFYLLLDSLLATCCLLDRLDDLLKVELLVEPLHGRDALAAVALLHPDVDEVLLLVVGLSIGKGVGAAPNGDTRVRERVCRSEQRGRLRRCEGCEGSGRLKGRPWRAAPTGAAPSEAKSMHGLVGRVGLRHGG